MAPERPSFVLNTFMRMLVACPVEGSEHEPLSVKYLARRGSEGMCIRDTGRKNDNVEWYSRK